MRDLWLGQPCLIETTAALGHLPAIRTPARVTRLRPDGTVWVCLTERAPGGLPEGTLYMVGPRSLSLLETLL